MPHRSIDSTLLAQLQQRDHTSWQMFYERYHDHLYAYVRSNIATLIDAEDIVQETMIAAFSGFGHYSGRASIFTWLCAIAKHKIADHYRRRKPTYELTPAHPAPSLGDRTGFWAALGGLPPHYEQVITLHYIEGLSVAEVAVRLGRSYKATESLLSRARDALWLALVAERVD